MAIFPAVMDSLQESRTKECSLLGDHDDPSERLILIPPSLKSAWSMRLYATCDSSQSALISFSWSAVFPSPHYWCSGELWFSVSPCLCCLSNYKWHLELSPLVPFRASTVLLMFCWKFLPNRLLETVLISFFFPNPTSAYVNMVIPY